jgi:hypothetical protein
MPSSDQEPQFYRVLSEYRDKADGKVPEDQLTRWVTPDDGPSIANAGGIRSQRIARAPAGSAPAFIYLFTSHVRTVFDNPWTDKIDHDTATVEYWGDAKFGKERSVGNRLLRQVLSMPPENRPPILHFVRVRVGFVRFSGLCVVREITERDYEDSEGNHVSNLFVQLAIAWKAQVLQAEVVERSAIATPWASRHAKHSSMILYHLGPVVRLDRPIANVDPSQTSFRSDRWTTQLALDRAVAAAEICLETESEWKLYEALKSRHVEFRLRLDLISRDSDDMPRGRTWFLLSPNHAVRFDGANGFLQVIGTMQRFTSLEAIVNEAISGHDPSA